MMSRAAVRVPFQCRVRFHSIVCFFCCFFVCRFNLVSSSFMIDDVTGDCRSVCSFFSVSVLNMLIRLNIVRICTNF